MVRFQRSERGMSLAWFAVVLLILGLPLASLSIDITRLMYVRGHLQTATDAACQAAADALDVPAFRDQGVRRINAGLAAGQANRVFNATLSDAGKIRFSASLSVGLSGPTVANCSASASLEPLIPISPNLAAQVNTVSEMRVTLNGSP